MNETSHEMAEAKRAEEHYEHRGDETRWEEPVTAQGPAQLSVMVSARFSPQEARQLSAAAAAAGMSRSAFVRQAAISAGVGKVVDVERVRRDVDEAERQLADARKALA